MAPQGVCKYIYIVLIEEAEVESSGLAYRQSFIKILYFFFFLMFMDDHLMKNLGLINKKQRKPSTNDKTVGTGRTYLQTMEPIWE